MPTEHIRSTRGPTLPKTPLLTGSSTPSPSNPPPTHLQPIPWLTQSAQTAHCYGHKRSCNQIQGRHYDGRRQPGCVIGVFSPSPLPIIHPASYGSLARFKDVQRLHAVGNHTVLGASGDMSDFQYIQSLMDDLVIEEFTEQDEHTLGPAEIHEYLSQLMYGRRSQMDPL